MKHLFASVALAATLAAGAAGAVTTFNGDTIHAYYIFPTDGTVLNDLGTFTAPGGGSIYSEQYNVSGDQITVSSATGVFWLAASFNGLKFVDQSRDPHIVKVTLDSSSTAPVSASDASWTSDSVEFNFQNQSWGAGQQAVFDVQFGNGVPEPATWALMFAGIAGLGAALRTRRRAPALA